MSNTDSEHRRLSFWRHSPRFVLYSFGLASIRWLASDSEPKWLGIVALIAFMAGAFWLDSSQSDGGI